MSQTESMSNQSHSCALSALHRAIDQVQSKTTMRRNNLAAQMKAIPRTSPERLQATQNDQPHDIAGLMRQSRQAVRDDKETVLYLAYGSNLAAQTFLGRRGIRPLSQVNIVAPEIRLTFDLPGVAYSEPCFGNSRYRTPEDEKDSEGNGGYHKNAWKKGLVGVVYEVTKADYVTIISTEGGGSGYHDVLVDCYELDSDPEKEVPLTPTGTPFKVHTLYAHRAQPLRPDPDYAQPSPRYLKLILDGAEEHDLPTEYRHFLANIRTYRATTSKQRLGSFVFLAVWGPFFLFLVGAAKIFQDKDGIYPPWFVKWFDAFYKTLWASYDNWFKPLFGDGERTIGDELDGKQSEVGLQSAVSEKTPLIRASASQRLNI